MCYNSRKKTRRTCNTSRTRSTASTRRSSPPRPTRRMRYVPFPLLSSCSLLSTLVPSSPNLTPALLVSTFQENLAAQYLAKVRKLQKDLEDAEDRAETAESALNKARSRARANAGGGGIGRQTSREVSRPLSPLHNRYHSCTLLSPTSSTYSDSNSRYSSHN